MGPKGPFTFLDWANKYGQVYKIVFMDSMAVVLTNADVIARITKKTGGTRFHAWHPGDAGLLAMAVSALLAHQ